MTLLEGTVIGLVITCIVNWAVLLYFIWKYSEKITLLSHVALQYINEQEVKEAREKVSERERQGRQIVAHVNSSDEFLTRRMR